MLEILRNNGYETEVALVPTTHAEKDKATYGTSDDITFVRHAVEKQLSRGKNVVLVGHSYGAIPAMASCTGLDKVSRQAASEASSVIGVACIPGAIPPPGFALVNMFGGNYPPFYQVQDDLSMPTAGKGPLHLFYNDVAEDIARDHVRLFKSQSIKVPKDKSPDVLTPCTQIPIGYIICTKDNAQNPTIQASMVKTMAAKGLTVYAEEADSGHSVFISRADETARFIRKIAGETGIVTGFQAHKPQ